MHSRRDILKWFGQGAIVGAGAVLAPKLIFDVGAHLGLRRPMLLSAVRCCGQDSFMPCVGFKIQLTNGKLYLASASMELLQDLKYFDNGTFGATIEKASDLMTAIACGVDPLCDSQNRALLKEEIKRICINDGPYENPSIDGIARPIRCDYHGGFRKFFTGQRIDFSFQTIEPGGFDVQI